MASENPYRSPETDCESVSGRKRRSLWWLLFSFEGRISRREFWLASLSVWLTLLVPVLLIDAIYGHRPPMVHKFAPLFFEFLSLWMFLAVQAKRWQDRDKSRAWVFINFFPPIIGPIWALIETGFLRGTPGPNEYGEDPT